MEAVLEAENVTLALINQFGRFILQIAHKKDKSGLPFSLVFMNQFGCVILQNAYNEI